MPRRKATEQAKSTISLDVPHLRGMAHLQTDRRHQISLFIIHNCSNLVKIYGVKNSVQIYKYSLIFK